MIRRTLQKHITSALQRLGVSGQHVSLAHPPIDSHGDYASSIALQLFQKKAAVAGTVFEEKQSPLEIAAALVEELRNDPELTGVVSRIETAGPGFINFWLSHDYLAHAVDEITEKENEYGKLDIGQNKSIVFEFGQPNTHKLPHVGHLRSYVTGDALSRILEYAGYNVHRVNYQGDVGLHVAKCLWSYRQLGFDKQQNNDGQITKLQEAYQHGSKAYEESEEAKTEIDALNKKIYEKDPGIYDLWKETREWSLKHYSQMHDALGISYDKQYYESQVAEKAKSLVIQHTGTIFEESEGAVIFRGEKYGLHNRVFLSSIGNPTYEAKDLALAFQKEKDFSFGRSLISTSTEQIHYFKVVYKAVEQIDRQVALKFAHIPFGMVSLKGKKLSSREGTIVSIDDYMRAFSEAYSEAGFEQKIENDTERRKVIMGAVKYSMLTNAVSKNIVCDIEENVQLTGNTGPYLQYTYARCKSVLERAGTGKQYGLRITGYTPEEELLLRTLYRFPEAVEEAADAFSPHFISTFLFDLAQKYNQFYQNVSILQAGESEKNFRLALSSAVAQVLKNGLGLLGIQVLERM